MRSSRIALVSLFLAMATSAQAAGGIGGGYAVVISRATHAMAPWRAVADELVRKYPGAAVIVYDGSVRQSRDELRRVFPRYACFVARSEEAGRQFVADVHNLTRQLDSDPYTDVRWGILTGYDAANAQRIARHAAPLVIRSVGSGTEVALDMCERGTWYCELVKGKVVQRAGGDEPSAVSQTPPDTTRALAELLQDPKTGLFVTSGHATERDWQIGYRYRNGSFISKAGQLMGRDTSGKVFDIVSPTPKVYLPIGNCLMGHIDGDDAMALAWMNTAGVHQMMGYTVLTWYGYGGWGCLDYFLEQPGRYTFTEAFHANHHALIHRLETYFPRSVARAQVPPGARPRIAGLKLSDEAKAAGLKTMDATGLLFDRDVVAFYGDPAWSARMADRPRAYDQELKVDGDEYVFTILPRRGADSFKPVNTNGAQRGWRPVVHFLPHRIGAATIVEGTDLKPVVADDFILVPNPRQCDPKRAYRVRFRAKPLVTEKPANLSPAGGSKISS